MSLKMALQIARNNEMANAMSAKNDDVKVNGKIAIDAVLQAKLAAKMNADIKDEDKAKRNSILVY